MKKLIGLLAVLGSSLCIQAIGHAESDDKVYLVDMQKVINESIIGKAARNSLEAEAKKRQAALAGQKSDLEKIKIEIEKQSSVLSPNALEERRADLEKKAKAFERAVQDDREALSRQNGAEIEKIVKEINQVVQDLAGKDRYKFIIEKDARFVLYSDPHLDISEEVLKTLDSKKVGL